MVPTELEVHQVERGRVCALGAKRTGRDPFNVGHPYEGSNPDLVGLFRHCGTETFAGKLPW